MNCTNSAILDQPDTCNPAIPTYRANHPRAKPRATLTPWHDYVIPGWYTLIPHVVYNRCKSLQAIALWARMRQQYMFWKADCFPKQRTMARDFDMSERQIRRHLQALINADLLIAHRIDGKRRKNNMYELPAWLDLLLCDIKIDEDGQIWQGIEDGFHFLPFLTYLDGRLSCGAVHAVGYLLARSATGAMAHPKTQSIAKDLGVTQRSVELYLVELAQEGYIIRDFIDSQNAVYLFCKRRDLPQPK